MKLKLPILAAVLFAGISSSLYAETIYKYFCERCGSQFCSNRANESFCRQPSCNGRAKRMDYPGGDPNAVSNDRWQTRREVNRLSHEKRRQVRDTMYAMQDRRIARQNQYNAELAQLSAQSNFSLQQAIYENYNAFPQEVQDLIGVFQQRNGFYTLVPLLGNRQEETYQAMLLLIDRLQSPNAQETLNLFWQGYANTVSQCIQVNRMHMQNVELDCILNQYVFLAVTTVKAYDPNFESNWNNVQSIFLGYLQPFNPNNLPEGARQLRESFLGPSR